MGVLKILVLSAIVFVTLGENIRKPQVKPTTVINTRCKRETEIDAHSRDKVKVSLSRKTARPLVPVTKRLNPIHIHPYNVLPRRNMTPAIKPKALNCSEDSMRHSEVEHNNDSKPNDDSVLDTVEARKPKVEPARTTKIDSKNENGYKNNKSKQEKETADQEIPKTITSITDIQIDDDNKSKQIESVPKMVEADIKKNNTKINQVSTKEAKTPTSNPVEKLLPTLLPNCKIVPDVPIQGNKPDRIEKPAIAEKDTKENLTDIAVEPLNLVKNNTKSEKIIDTASPKIVSLTILTDEGKIPIKMVPRVNPLKVSLVNNPILDATNKSTGITPQTNVKNQLRTTIEKPDVSTKSLETDTEEIVIQNNNYEELYEATPRYTSPKLIATDLRPASNWNHINTQPYETSIVPQTSDENKPLLYDIKKYDNQYVVTYDDTNRRCDNIINDSLYSNINDQDINAKITYTKNVSPWSQRRKSYNQPQIQDFERSDTDIQYQGYPSRIWRSWNNNQIFIKPKYGCAINSDLYKGLGRYLANANVQSTPVYASNRVGSSVNENQNTSPYLNPFQYTRYAY